LTVSAAHSDDDVQRLLGALRVRPSEIVAQETIKI